MAFPFNRPLAVTALQVVERARFMACIAFKLSRSDQLFSGRVTKTKSKCDTCGHDYDKSFDINKGGSTFDS